MEEEEKNGILVCTLTNHITNATDILVVILNKLKTFIMYNDIYINMPKPYASYKIMRFTYSQEHSKL